MIEKYIIGMAGIIGLMVAWAFVQHVWRKAFPDQHIDQDVLAGRSDCGSCGCTSPCVLKDKKNTKR